MPRTQQSPVIAIQQYFQSAPIDSAELMLEIVKGIVKQRGEWNTLAQTSPGPKVKGKVKAVAAAGPKKARKPRADKGKKRKGGEVEVPLPSMSLGEQLALSRQA